MSQQVGTLTSEYVSGGYYVARVADRSAYMSPELTPGIVLSASGCICDFLPDVWTIEWTSENLEQRLKQASAFGLSASDLPKVVAWATEAFGTTFGWPSSFYTLEAAQEVYARFLPQHSEVVIFGLGLHHTSAETFLATAKPEPPGPGFAPNGETGVFQCVSRGDSVVSGGDVWGFELLAASSGLLTCSWLCNGLEKECAKQLAVRTNRRGFVESYGDALRCAELISRDETAAEPGLWLPWLVTVYPRQSS